MKKVTFLGIYILSFSFWQTLVVTAIHLSFLVVRAVELILVYTTAAPITSLVGAHMSEIPFVGVCTTTISVCYWTAILVRKYTSTIFLVGMCAYYTTTVLSVTVVGACSTIFLVGTDTTSTSNSLVGTHTTVPMVGMYTVTTTVFSVGT